MKNWEKNELTNIVKGIPQEEIEKQSIANLWRRYASFHTYGTFRAYLKTFRKITKSTNTGNINAK